MTTRHYKRLADFLDAYARLVEPFDEEDEDEDEDEDCPYTSKIVLPDDLEGDIKPLLDEVDTWKGRPVSFIPWYDQYHQIECCPPPTTD